MNKNMKTLKNIFILGISLFMSVSCMNDFDEPEFKTPPFGNNAIGEANTTIAQLKEKYATTISSSGVEEITDDIIIEGVVVANDESGNIYKQFVIDDGTGSIIVGVNDVGLYAVMARGQKILIDCKGLHVGGYGQLAQIGGLYNGSIGRMNKFTFPLHVKLEGTPSPEMHGIEPLVIDETFFTNANKATLPRYVRMNNVHFEEADGTDLYAPEDIAYNNVVERTIKIGNTRVLFRFSTYADFANEVMPQGNFDITGVLTRYRDYWQFMLSSTNDIKSENE